MSVAGLIGAVVLTAYFFAGFELRAHVARLRQERRAVHALPHRLAFFGPSAWAWAFSGRHREIGDSYLTGLVMIWRAAIVTLPIGVLAMLASA